MASIALSSEAACLPIAVGIARDVSRRAARSAPGLLGACFALAVSAQGLASMFFHGSLTEWGAVLDALSIFGVIGTVLAANLLRARSIDMRGALLVMILALLLALGYRLWVAPVMALLALAAVIGIVASELCAPRREAPSLSRRWFWGALACFVLGGAVWAASLRMGDPLCSPSFSAGHALWQLLASAGSGALWLHLRDRLQGRPGSTE